MRLAHLQDDTDQVLLLRGVADFLRKELANVADDDLDPERLGAGLDDGDRLREDAAVDKDGLALLAELTERHDHGFRGGRSFVEEGGVGDVETGQGGGDGLEVDERFKATCESGDAGIRQSSKTDGSSSSDKSVCSP